MFLHNFYQAYINICLMGFLDPKIRVQYLKSISSSLTFRFLCLWAFWSRGKNMARIYTDRIFSLHKYPLNLGFAMAVGLLCQPRVQRCSFIRKEEEGGQGGGGGKKQGHVENALLEFHFTLEPQTDTSTTVVTKFCQHLQRKKLLPLTKFNFKFNIVENQNRDFLSVHHITFGQCNTTGVK